MTTAPSPAEVAAILQLLADARVTNYLTVAALTLLVFDHLLCIDKEVELVWKNRRSLANAIYLWNRYFSLAALGFNASWVLREVSSDTACVILAHSVFILCIRADCSRCSAFLHIEGTTITMVIGTVDVVLLLRVWILYGRSRKLLFWLIPFVFAEFITMVVLDVFVVLPMKEYVHVGPLLKGCYSFTVPKFYTYMAVPSLIVSFTMFLLTMYRCATTLIRNNRSRMPVVSLFLRDGVFWFLAVFAVMTPQILVAALARKTLGAIMIAPCLAAYSIISSRVLLNIKVLMTAKNSATNTTHGSVSLGEANFRVVTATNSGNMWST